MVGLWNYESFWCPSTKTCTECSLDGLDYAVLVEGLWSVILILKAICTYIVVVWYGKKTLNSASISNMVINFFDFQIHAPIYELEKSL